MPLAASLIAPKTIALRQRVPLKPNGGEVVITVEPALKILTEHQDTLRPLIISVQPLFQIQNGLESGEQEDKIVLRLS